jgi:hypothetical protein
MLDNGADGKDKHDPEPHGKGHGNKDSHNGHDADRIRVKMWDAHGAVIYDTQTGSSDDALASTDLGGGRIDIRSSAFDESPDDDVAPHFNENETSAYPNPFDDWMTVQFATESKEAVNVQLMEVTGKVIFNKTYHVSEDGSYTLHLPEGKRNGGLYVLKISQGHKVEFVRVLRK